MKRTMVVATCLAVGAQLVAVGVGQAATGPTVAGPTTVVEGNDYATDVLRDPWDYDTASDLLTDGNGPTKHTSKPVFAKNVLDNGVTEDWVAWEVPLRDVGGGNQLAAGWVSPLWMTFPAPDDVDPPDNNGALPDATDGIWNPIDTSQYTHASIYIFSDEDAAVRLEWFRCWEVTAECRGGHGFGVGYGWQHVTFPLVNNAGDLPQPWDGSVIGLRLTTVAEAPVHVRLAWLRLYTPGEILTVNGETTSIRWDLDQNGANNTAGQPGWGRLQDGKYFDVNAFPPGTYHLIEDNSYGDTITVQSRPRPVFLDPDVTGGLDFAATERGDAWDFAQASDVAVMRNIEQVEWLGTTELAPGVGAKGVLQAVNGQPLRNDPHFELSLNGRWIDTERYHRLTVRTHYDGAFELADIEGGGTHGRLIWRRPDSPRVGTGGAADYVDSKELVTFTDRTTYTYDLHSTLVGSVSEPGDPVWRAAPATMLRYDPNEDRGPRRWRLDDIRLAADDEANPTFDIRWRDPRHAAGTQVTLRLDTNRTGHNGTVLVSDLAQKSGTNTWTLDARDVEPGTYWVSIESTRGGVTGRTYSTGPLVVPARFSGPDRFQTAVRASEASHPDGADVAVVASGEKFADALAAGQVAAALGAPLLLVGATSVHPAVLQELGRLGPDRIVVAGGPATVGDEVIAELRSITSDVDRISGKDRYKTAAALAAVAQDVWNPDGATDTVVLASGDSFPDALSSLQLVARLRAPLLLVPRDAVDETSAAAIADYAPDQAIVIGGPGTLPDATVAGHVGQVGWRRVAGTGRMETAARTRAEAIAAGADGATVLLADGGAFPDALSAAGLLARRGGTLLLTNTRDLPGATADSLKATPASWLRAVGGPSSVWDRVLGQARAIS